MHTTVSIKDFEISTILDIGNLCLFLLQFDEDSRLMILEDSCAVVFCHIRAILCSIANLIGLDENFSVD